MPRRAERIRLGDLLIQQSSLTKEQLTQAYVSGNLPADLAAAVGQQLRGPELAAQIQFLGLEFQGSRRHPVGD